MSTLSAWITENKSCVFSANQLTLAVYKSGDEPIPAVIVRKVVMFRSIKICN